MKNYICIILFFIFLPCTKTMGQIESISSDELMKNGQYAQALVVLEKLNAGDSTQMEVLKKRALCNYKLGRLKESKKLYYSILKTSPNNIELLLQIANIHEKEFNLLEAFKTYSQLSQIDSLNTFYIKELARISTRMERPKEAIVFLEKAVKFDENDLESLTALANLYLNIPKDNLAVPLIRRAFVLDSASIKTRHLRSRLFYRSSDFKGVIGDVEFTMFLGDTSSYYQRLLATAYYHDHQLSKSISTFKRLISIGEDKENIRAGLGYALLESTESDAKILNESVRNFSEAFALGKSDHLEDYEISIAEAMAKLGEFDLAIRNLGRFLHKPKAVFLTGEIYNKNKKNPAMALLYYQEYLKVCSKQKKPTTDCNYIDLATRRINELNPTLKLEIPKIVAQKDSVETVIDTVRHD